MYCKVWILVLVSMVSPIELPSESTSGEYGISSHLMVSGCQVIIRKVLPITVFGNVFEKYYAPVS